MLNTCLKCVVFSVFQCYRYSIIYIYLLLLTNTNNGEYIQEKINHGYFVTKIQFQENREVGFCQLHAESSLALRIPNCGLQQAKMRGSSTLDTRDFPCQYPDKENRRLAGWAGHWQAQQAISCELWLLLYYYFLL